MANDKSRKLMYEWWAKLKKAPIPRNALELELLSEWYFGKKLHASFDVYGDSGSYQITEVYNSYHGKGFEFSENCGDGYDHSRNFWNHVFGELSCGGIATRSYGQFKIKGYRHKRRLMAWQKMKARQDANYIRPAFVRLARNVGAGENRTIRGNSVLITGREDGAVRASIS